ncbi:DUF4251 domain-containing protein [Lutimonas sp.]|uniref:DUF4251 domain-containing protein n=1 Tax=Lutimonas sp. TaxID=1872403 RepID=UPI003D9B1671
MKKLTFLFIFSLLLTSTMHSQSKKELKAEAAAKEFKAMNELIDSKNYEFMADWATSQGGRRVNLTTNANFLKIKNDSADIYLPYFGTMTSGGAAMTSDGGIVFSGVIDKYEKTIDEKKLKITVRFSAKTNNDQFDFFMTMYKGGNTLVNLNSNYRSGIKYDGRTGEIRVKK